MQLTITFALLMSALLQLAGAIPGVHAVTERSPVTGKYKLSYSSAPCNPNVSDLQVLSADGRSATRDISARLVDEAAVEMSKRNEAYYNVYPPSFDPEDDDA